MFKAKEQLLLKNGLPVSQDPYRACQGDHLQFVVPQRHRSAAMDGCHREAAHQGQRRSASLMQEQFWWPGMARDLRNCIRKCGRCRKFEAAPPIAPMQPLTCSGPGSCCMLILPPLRRPSPERGAGHTQCVGLARPLL